MFRHDAHLSSSRLTEAKQDLQTESIINYRHSLTGEDWRWGTDPLLIHINTAKMSAPWYVYTPTNSSYSREAKHVLVEQETLQLQI